MQHFPFAFTQINKDAGGYVINTANRLNTDGGYEVSPLVLDSFLQPYIQNGGIPVLLLNAQYSNHPSSTQTTTYNLGQASSILDSVYVGTSADNTTMTEVVNGKVYKFDVNNLQYIETLNNRLINRDLFTFSCWFKATGTVVQRTLMSVDTFAPRISWQVTQTVQALWSSTLATGVALDHPVGVWHHSTVVNNGTNVIIYKNGVQVASNVSPTAGVTNTNKINVGKSSGSAFNFNGNIDNVAFYDTALTAGQILNIFNAQKSRFGL